MLDFQPTFNKHLVSRSCGVSGINSKQMANMSYCRFENTYRDLQECYDALTEAGSIKEVEENANQYEKKYIRKLVELCKDIAADLVMKRRKKMTMSSVVAITANGRRICAATECKRSLSMK